MLARRAYDLSSTWVVPAPRDECWDLLADPRSWQDWWPHLRSSVVREGGPDGVGTRGALVYRSPLSYRLRIGIEVTASGPPAWVELRVVGDLQGRARADLTELRREGRAWTRVHTAWPVRTTRPWMNALGGALGPAFAWAHARVMADGERGLMRRVADAASG